MKKQIVFTGGGSAGHVSVNLALIPLFLQEGWAVAYFGSEDGMERELLTAHPEVTYYPIKSGKLRRYFDWKNFRDPFHVLKGTYQAYRLFSRLKPNVLFSKGGFVSVPVVLAARLHHVPVVLHESDLTPGLANKISIPFANLVCTTFPETNHHLPSGKSRYVGPVIREELKAGNAQKGRAICGFTPDKPVLLIMGGSLGARKINQVVREALPRLTGKFQFVHLCGKGNLDHSIQVDGYCQYEYVTEELPDFLAMADLVVSRAGANAIFEFRALCKPMLLIPLPLKQSRGDQIANAHSFSKSGYCRVLLEENLTSDALEKEIEALYHERHTYIQAMAASQQEDALQTLFTVIHEAGLQA
ncbi:MAG: undecaprenyldiphospho-muramoylpentapeptide beta-N-acetylglucosaminyltransferase [Clostridia bacterium]